MMLTVLLIACLLVNVVTFALYGIDKRRAKKNRWRIRERTLLGFTWLMGGVGAVLGMRVFRHKTQHLAFMVSAPVAAVLQIALMVCIAIRLL